MLRALLIASIFIPSLVFAATFNVQKEIAITEPVKDNAYLVGLDVAVSNTTGADVGVIAGSVRILAPIVGDAFLLGGSVAIDDEVRQDARILAGSVRVSGPVYGELLAFGGNIVVEDMVQSAVLTGISVSVLGGAKDSVRVYAVETELAGEFMGDVTVVASELFTIAEGTTIHGNLRYNAPVQLEIPPTVIVNGDVVYTGSHTFIPSMKEAQSVADAGVIFYEILKVFSLLLLSVLLLVAFPNTIHILTRSFTHSTTVRKLQSAGVGFLLFLLTPLLLFLLLFTFVGAYLALIGMFLYALIILVSPAIGVLLMASLLRQKKSKTHIVTFSYVLIAGVLFYLIALTPFLGGVFTVALMSLAFGVVVFEMGKRRE